MKVKTAIAIAFLLVSCLQVHAASYPETREYLLGDIDNFLYDGPGSVDDVYVDPVYESLINHDGSRTIDGFDVIAVNHDIPFTFEYPLGPSETVVNASLIVGLRATTGLVTTDAIMLDGLGVINMFWFEDLGWLPMSDTERSIKVLDLGNVLGNDFLPMLQDGQFNVRLWDDVAVDYAILSMEVIPEPATLSLLALGGLAMLRRRRK